MKLRTLQDWVQKAGAPPARRPGRPAHDPEKRAWALREVEEEWCRQGLGSGEGSIAAAIGGRVSRTLIRESLRTLKAALRRRERDRIEGNRKHVEVLARDALWSHDAMEVSRGHVDATSGASTGVPLEVVADHATWPCLPEEPRGPLSPHAAFEAPERRPASGVQACPAAECVKVRRAPAAAPSRSRRANILQAEITRDVASTWTIHASLGPPANDLEVIEHLESACRLRGTYPFILSVDNRYNTLRLRTFARRHRIVLLVNFPRTPQHNAPVEHGNAEIRLEGGLPKHGPTLSPAESAARIVRALRPLNYHRRRRTRDFRTAADFDLALPRASDVCSRVAFYETTCSALARATAPLDSAVERRRVRREVILSAAVSFMLIQWTRGRSRTPLPIHATIS